MDWDCGHFTCPHTDRRRDTPQYRSDISRSSKAEPFFVSPFHFSGRVSTFPQRPLAQSRSRSPELTIRLSLFGQRDMALLNCQRLACCSGEHFSTAQVSVAQLDRVSASEGHLETLANASFPLFYAVSASLSSSGKLSKIMVAGVATPA
jgi:hypothetical protein